MEFSKQFTAEYFCSALVYDELPQLEDILWVEHLQCMFQFVRQYQVQIATRSVTF